MEGPEIGMPSLRLAGLPVIAQAQPPGVEKMDVVTEKVAEGLYMLKGAGGGGRPHRQAGQVRPQHALAHRPHGGNENLGSGVRSSWPMTTCASA